MISKDKKRVIISLPIQSLETIEKLKPLLKIKRTSDVIDYCVLALAMAVLENYKEQFETEMKGEEK